MLLQFSVENYKSFNEPTVFSMRASRIKGHSHHIIQGAVPTLRGAAIYGPNASGKSNLILAMGFARDLVVRGTAVGRSIPTQPHALRTDGNRVSKFKWHFVYEGKIWSYGFAVEARRVVEEYLYARNEKGGAEQKWFERTHENDKVVVSFGTALRGPARDDLAQRLKFIAQNIAARPEQLFLTFAIENSVEELRPVYRWFNEILFIIRAESVYSHIIEQTYINAEFLHFMSDFLKFADTEVERLSFRRVGFRFENLTSFSAEQRADIEAEIVNLEREEIVFFHLGVAGQTPLSVAIERDANDNLWGVELSTIHLNESGEEVQFPLSWESEGTQRLLHLIPALYAHKNQSAVFVVDELDRRLHTSLTRKFVELTLDCASESCSQLIFTTHDTNLLDNELLRRDEIWLAQKEHGATQLTSLAEYDIRSDLNYEDAYLEGRFEAIPRFRGEKKLMEMVRG